MTREVMALDSARRIDENGFLHVDAAPVTKAQVVPYMGREIPGWQGLGLDPEKVYFGYRSAEELARPETVQSLIGIPIQIEHHADFADDPAKETRAGSTGSDAVFDAPYLRVSLHIQDDGAITNIKTGRMRELSLGYRYTPVLEQGEFEGEHYDFRITAISCNHLALVPEGRAGHDVVVPDSFPREVKDRMEEKEQSAAPAAQDAEQTATAAPAAQDGREELISALVAELQDAGVDAAKVREKIEQILAAPAAQDEEAAPDAAAAPAEAAPAAEDDDLDGPAPAAAPDAAPAAEDECERIIKDGLTAAGLDPESADGKAFAQGVRYGEKLRAEEPKKLDAEHESEGEKKALGEDAMSRIMRALTARARAAEEVKEVLGAVQALSFDSAGAIYRKALRQLGINAADMTGREARAAYRAAVKMRNAAPAVLAQDAAPSKPSAVGALLGKVRVGY